MPIIPDHPRPQLQRSGWVSLDGEWQFALDEDAECLWPDQVTFDRRIAVPFAPETEASGIAHEGFLRRCWYKRQIDLPRLKRGERLFLHFGAVDRTATVFVNGQVVAVHTGGYTPFSAEITDVIGNRRTAELAVRADDDPFDQTVPRGKQDWQAEPHFVWYPRTTGIWQTVWMERVPEVSIQRLHWHPDVERFALEIEAFIEGAAPNGAHVLVEIRHGDRVLVDDAFALPDPDAPSRTLRRGFTLPHSIDDAFELTWRPGNPTLLEARIQVVHGSTIDEVHSYTALRSVRVENGRFVLNGRPKRLRMALDQGYWPRSGMTAPEPDALRRDVELALELGLNAVRKHQKIEDPRWLYWCDRLGLLVWEELPSAYLPGAQTVPALTSEWAEAIERDRDHPCVIAWVPLNESWGVPLATRDPGQRALVETMCALTHALDPSRPVSANDGWETSGGEIVGVHDYAQDPAVIRRRYGTAERLEQTVRGDEPALRPVTLDGSGPEGRAVVLSEFGGHAIAGSAPDLFAYHQVPDAAAYLRQVAELCAAANESDALAGWCWTQLTDTYQEANGLLTMDRAPKAPIAELRRALTSRP